MQSKINKSWINVLGIVVPVLVGLILGVQQKVNLGSWTKLLPHVIGMLNALTALLLISAFVAIKNNNKIWHARFNKTAFVLGAVFLVLYILYHISNPSTPSTAMGKTERAIYLFLLISHILLSLVVVRYVLLAMFYGINNQIVAHKKVVKIAFPLWLYVSITGVMVYLMIRPYYSS
jgi:putative membrane protein